MEAKVLLFHLKNETGKKIQKLCTRLKIESIHVEKKDFLKPLKEIAGIEEINKIVKTEKENTTLNRAEKEEAELDRADEVSGSSERLLDFSESMLVLVDFTDELLDRYLKEYKVMHIDHIDLKAVLTEYNQNWNVIKLYEELCGEREYFRKNSVQA